MRILLLALLLTGCATSPKFKPGDCVSFDVRKITDAGEITGRGYAFPGIKILETNQTVKNDKYHVNVYSGKKVYLVQILGQHYKYHTNSRFAMSQRAIDDMGHVFWQLENASPNYGCNNYRGKK